MGQRNRAGAALACIAMLYATLTAPTAVAMDAAVRDAKQLIRTGQYTQAEQRLRSAADQNPDAAYELARLYQTGLAGGRSQAEVLQRLIFAAQAGHVDAMYLLGRTYSDEHTEAYDLSIARDWLQRASNEGHRRARSMLDVLSERAETSTEKLPSAASAVQACDDSALKGLRQSTRTAQEITPAQMRRMIDCPNAVQMLRIAAPLSAGLSTTDASGNSLLHVAVARGRVEVAAWLIEKGVTGTSPNTDGWTAAMLAERSGSRQLKGLFGITASERERPRLDLDAALASDRFRGWSLLTVAAWHGADPAISRLIDQGQDVNRPDATGNTPISRALQRQQLSSARILLAAGADLDESDAESFMKMADAALVTSVLGQAGGETVMPWLLCAAVAADRGEHVEVILQADTAGKLNNARCARVPVLSSAIKRGAADAAAALLRNNVLVAAVDEEGCTALCWALRMEQQTLATALVDAGATNQPTMAGVTPLMHAARTNHLPVARALLSAGADVTESARSGSHALLLAATAGHADMVKRLLDAGAEPDQKNNVGDTALIVAVREGQFEVASLLIERGGTIGAKNNRDESAYDLAMAKKDDRWHQLVESSPLFKKLFASGS